MGCSRALFDLWPKCSRISEAASPEQRSRGRSDQSKTEYLLLQHNVIVSGRCCRDSWFALSPNPSLDTGAQKGSERAGCGNECLCICDVSSGAPAGPRSRWGDLLLDHCTACLSHSPGLLLGCNSTQQALLPNRHRSRAAGSASPAGHWSAVCG